MDGRITARRDLERDLRRALAFGQLALHYQPIVDLATGRVSSCEALMRWRHPERGFVSPADFIPIAEETGIIHELGAWALGEATRTAAGWPDGIKVAVNLSPAQFSGPDLAAITAAALADSGLSPSRLELEITESVLIEDDASALAMLHRLAGLGVAIALDDFGTGYSSLSYLQGFPVDTLKIDRSFVTGLDRNDECREIVRTILNLARTLRLEVIAEGAETAAQIEFLEGLDCGFLQGFFFSRPVPPNELAALLLARTADQRTLAASPRTAHRS